MTFSILARDPESGALGGAAATGNLCVGAWVLRGKAGIGLSASQGHYPSTLWGEAVLDAMAKGDPADHAVRATVAPDHGKHTRQLLALDHTGNGGCFSGTENLPQIAEKIRPDICAAGNMLSSSSVIGSMVESYMSAPGSFAHRLLAALFTASDNGGDMRGLMSAAILIVSPEHPAIDLRIDYNAQPLRTLQKLIERTEEKSYASWSEKLPTKTDPWRTQ